MLQKRHPQTIDISEDANQPADFATVPDEFDTFCGLIVPASMDSTVIKFKTLTAKSGSEIYVQDGAGADYSVTITSSAAFIPLDTNTLAGVDTLMVEAQTNETADRACILISRKF